MDNTDKLTFIQRIFLRCAGIDLQTMSLCPSSEITKYSLIGGCVLIPTVLALITGGYAVYKISDSFSAACLIAPVWAWVIFMLDRAIVANTDSNRINAKFLSRVLLATFIAVLISQPIELLVFRDVISEKRNTDIELNKTIATQKYSEKIDSLERKIEALDEQVKIRRNDYIDEVANGNSSVGRGAGRGPIAIILNEQLVVDSIDNEKKKGLLFSEIRELSSKIEILEKNVISNYSDGLLGDLELLYQVTEESKTVKYASVFFFFFFLILELIPIIIKMGSLGKDGDTYTKLKKIQENEYLDAMALSKNDRTELVKKEQLKLLSDRVQKIDLEIEKGSMKESAKNHSFYVKTVKATSNEINNLESDIAKKIKNEAVREHLITQVLKIYFEFSSSLETIAEKIAKFHRKDDK